jgi:transporter family protein
MENSYLPIALCSMFFYGLGDVIFKIAARKGLPSHQFLIMQTIFFLPSALALGIASSSIQFGIPFLYGMSAGVTLYFALLYFATSLSAGDVSIVAPVFRSSFILSAILAIIFLNEPLTVYKILAFFLLVIAAFLLLSNLNVQVSRVAQSAKKNRTIRTLAIATILLGITGFIYKLGAIAGGNSISILTGQAIVFFTLAFLSCYHKEKKIIFVWKYLYLGFSAALFLFLGLYLLLEALKYGPASTIVPISQMSFVVTAIVGIYIFKEKILWQKILGLACSIGAIILLAQ